MGVHYTQRKKGIAAVGAHVSGHTERNGYGICIRCRVAMVAGAASGSRPLALSSENVQYACVYLHLYIHQSPVCCRAEKRGIRDLLRLCPRARNCVARAWAAACLTFASASSPAMYIA